MKTYKKILFVSIFVFLGFWSSQVYSEDLLGDFSESINSIQEELDSLPTSELKEAVIIDEAIIEINKSIEFIEQSMINHSPIFLHWYQKRYIQICPILI